MDRHARSPAGVASGDPACCPRASIDIFRVLWRGQTYLVVASLPDWILRRCRGIPADRRHQRHHDTMMRRIAWRNYTNARFQYTVRYPRGLLIPQGESDNGDGQRFLGHDGATLTVWGGHNTRGQTLAQFEADTLSRLTGNSGAATRRKRHPTWFVVSGITEDKIFHAKTLLVSDMQKSFEFTYPRERADVYSAVTARIVSSFRSLETGR